VSSIQLRPYGERGLLILLHDDVQDVGAAVRGWAEAVRAAQLPEVVDVVPAARSVLLHLTDSQAQQAVRSIIASMQPLPTVVDDAGDVVEIDVVYDGPDLDVVASVTGLTVSELVAAHTGVVWRSAFAGFAPGFAYLTSTDGRLRVPRRAEPRSRVPPGSVALAAGYSAVYPRASPGGWQLIGHTDRRMWDLERQPPALLPAGRQVRFVARPG
jgi:KipI family sensor histidine kinase inhibitor